MRGIPLRLRQIISLLYVPFSLLALNVYRVLRTSPILDNIGWREFGVLVFGPRFLYGKNVDIRSLWEKIRRTDGTYLPYLPSHLNGLEIAVNLLMPKSIPALEDAKYCLMMLLVLFLNDESAHPGNHGIGCLLAKHILTRKLRLRNASRLYLLRAYNEYRKNSKDGFYNEGSTHYHVFTIWLFAAALPQAVFLKCFRRAIGLSQELTQRKELHFGDVDPFDVSVHHYGAFGYFNADQKSQPAAKSVVKRFKERYFCEVPLAKGVIFVKTFNEGVWGHEREECGDIRLVFNNKCLVHPRPSIYYTLNLSHRKQEKLLSKNGLSDPSLDIHRYFAPVPKMSCAVVREAGDVVVSSTLGLMRVTVSNDALLVTPVFTGEQVAGKLVIGNKSEDVVQFELKSGQTRSISLSRWL